MGFNGLVRIRKIPFTTQQLVGVLVIIGGVIVFKFGGVYKEKREVREVQSQLKHQVAGRS